MKKTKILVVPLDISGEYKPYPIWQKVEGEMDTFKVPGYDVDLNCPVAFWASGHGIIAFGKINSEPFKKDDVEDRNNGELVADVIFQRILEEPAHVKEEEFKPMGPFPKFTYSPSLLEAYTLYCTE